MFLTLGALLTVEDILGSDAHAYWVAAHSGTPYDRAPGDADAFLYSPAFLLAISPLAVLAWPQFFAVWVLVESAVLVWLIKPLPKRWGIPVAMCCLPELTIGNINLLIAGATVLALRTPALWIFQVFTKVTLGIGVLWFAFRGDWQRLLQSIVAILAAIGLSFAVDSTAFLAWIEFLLGHKEGTADGQLGFFLRCVAAILLLAVGARTSKAWLIAPALLLASPIAFNYAALSLLAAIPRLNRIGTDDTAANSSKSRNAKSATGM